MQLAIADRQRAIVELVNETGTVSAAELVDKLGVSLMTVHRDLDALQERGILRKERGGATAMPTSVFEARLNFRRTSNGEAKQRIAAAAMQFVEPGMSLLLDDSSTVLCTIDHLIKLEPLHVATFSLAVLERLRDAPGIQKIAIGGDYSAVYDAFLGSRTLELIASLHADVAFMSGSAVIGGAFYHQQDSVVAVKRAAMEVSQRKYLLLDATKFERTALHRVAQLSEFDAVVTDLSDPEILARLRGEGVTIVTV